MRDRVFGPVMGGGTLYELPPRTPTKTGHMVEELMTVKLRLRDGNITELDIAEIIEIDGVAFVPQVLQDSKLDAVIDSINHTNGRVDALQNMMQVMLGHKSGPPIT